MCAEVRSTQATQSLDLASAQQRGLMRWRQEVVSNRRISSRFQFMSTAEDLRDTS